MNSNNKKETMTLVAETMDNAETEANIPATESAKPDTKVENEILDVVANSKATFKSQQKGDPDLSFDEKRKIAFDLLHKSHSLFLSKFGEYLNKEHLSFFNDSGEDYEICYHINRLKRYFNNTSRQIDVKNRRYQALKIMVEKGEYFSETEMMKRNPLLYENLIGQYLTEEQKKKRDNIDTTNITFVNLLLESIERDRVKTLKKNQEEAEDSVLEENESDDDWNEIEGQKTVSSKRDCSRWGEMSSTSNSHEKQDKEQRLKNVTNGIPLKERQILREEFVTHMYQSFLDGKDIDFDYSTVDDNESYDNVNIRNQDEEEKYFDSESPETVLVENIREESDLEDELDVYMKSLKEQCPTNQLDTESSVI